MVRQFYIDVVKLYTKEFRGDVETSIYWNIDHNINIPPPSLLHPPGTRDPRQNEPGVYDVGIQHQDGTITIQTGESETNVGARVSAAWQNPGPGNMPVFFNWYPTPNAKAIEACTQGLLTPFSNSRQSKKGTEEFKVDELTMMDTRQRCADNFMRCTRTNRRNIINTRASPCPPNAVLCPPRWEIWHPCSTRGAGTSG